MQYYSACTDQLGSLDNVPPVLVDLSEATAFLWHLGHDVRGGEDGLEIEPGSLYFEPFIEDLLDQQQLALPLSVRGGLIQNQLNWV